MPTLLTAGDATTGAVITSGSDGIIKIQTGPAGAKVDALTIDAAGNITVLGALTAAASVFDNSAAATDVALLLGQTAYYDLTAATSKALKIACADNQAYEMTLVLQGNGNVGISQTTLSPNNTTYTNSFSSVSQFANTGGTSFNGGFTSAFAVAYRGDIRNSRSVISTKTASKTVVTTSLQFSTNTSLEVSETASAWQASASSNTLGDTSTAWTSLGTLTFPVAVTGRVYVKRVA